jgi:hypothetical protein
MFSLNYIPAFVNNEIFGGIIFNELVIKCFEASNQVSP